MIKGTNGTQHGPSTAENMLAAGGISLFSAFGFVAYGSVLVAIGRNQTKFKNSFYSLVFSLGVSDCSMLALYLLYSVPCTILQKHIFGPIFDQWMGVLCNLTYYSSIPAWGSIAINRYVAICHYSTFQTLYAPRNVRLNIGLLWLVGLCECSFQTQPCCHLRFYFDLYSWGYDTSLWGFKYYSTWENCFVGGVALLTVGVYVPIALHQRKRNKTKQRRRQNKEMQLALQFLLIAIYGVIFAAAFTTLPMFTASRWHLFCSTLLYIGNCSINPFIYVALSKSVRMEVFKLYGIRIEEDSTPRKLASTEKRSETFTVL